MFIYILILFLILFLHFYWNHQRLYGKYNLKGPFALPLIGNLLNVRWIPFYEYERNNFIKYGDTFVDYTLTKNGCITTSNPRIIKKILIKDFNNFRDRLIPGYLPEYSRKALIFLQQKDWKRVRIQVTPVFTSGRLKKMYKNFDRPIKNCINNIEELINNNQADDVKVKKLMRSFALDCIGHTVFSLETNTFKDDEFSRKVTDLFSIRLAWIMLSFILPDFINEYFDLSLFNTETVKYFSKLTLNLIKERKNNKGEIYNDFIELLLKSEEEGDFNHIDKKLSLEEIVGQCFIFFVAGLEPVSSTLQMLLLELALNHKIQDKLYQDLLKNYPEDKVEYDEINKSNYLKCVINETLRKHVTFNRIFRIAQNDYEFDEFKVLKGQVLGVSLYNLHHDSSLFPQPEKFKPERFENNQIEDDIYKPFGDGSRNCIGQRFALLEISSIIIRLIKKYKVNINDKTLPLEYRNGIIVNLIDNLSLKFERR